MMWKYKAILRLFYLLDWQILENLMLHSAACGSGILIQAFSYSDVGGNPNC